MTPASTKWNGRPSSRPRVKADLDQFRLEQHRGVTLLKPAKTTETLDWDLSEEVALLVLGPLRKIEVPLLVVDLSGVDFFGSVFLSLLLRWWKTVAAKGGTMVIAGASHNARELLRITSLDTLWAIYDTSEEAVEVLNSE